jgi:hypothetical protein
MNSYKYEEFIEVILAKIEELENTIAQIKRDSEDIKVLLDKECISESKLSEL